MSRDTGTTCIIIAESDTLGLPPVSRKAKYSDRDLGHAPALPGMPSY